MVLCKFLEYLFSKFYEDFYEEVLCKFFGFLKNLLKKIFEGF